MIYILIFDYPLSKFMFSNLDGIKPIFIPIPKRTNLASLFRRILNKIFLKIKVLAFYFPFKTIKQIKKIGKNDSLIFVGDSVQTCYVLSRICKKNKKVCFFWNSCVTIKNCEQSIARIRKSGFSIATFDSEDAQKHNLLFANQFYRNVSGLKKENTKIENDFFFCGKNKGRKEILMKMQNVLSSTGICKFIVPEKEDALQYQDYIDDVNKSRVLCDVNQKSQSGLTLRVLESLFFGKKLITNNVNVKNYDFYNPNNILIFSNETTKENVQSFLKKPYEEVDGKILSKYDVTNVFKKIIQEIDE